MAAQTAPYRPRILLTGATGYVGGTILNQLLTSTDQELANLPPVTALVRGADRGAKLVERYGGDRIRPVEFSGFDDVEFLRKQASQHDVVINAGTGFHATSAEALVRGLEDGRNSGTGVATPSAWMLHTSGCSNIADHPITGEARPNAEWPDADPDSVYKFEKAEDARDPYPQRTSELLTLDTAASTAGKVNAVSVQIPNMIGTGEGLFQNASLIIPIMMGYVLTKGYAFSAGDGTGIIDWVHISDVAGLYVLLVKHICIDGGSKIPRNERGFLFPAVGRTLMREIAQRCLDVCFEAGVLPLADGPKEKEIRPQPLEEVATTTAGNMTVAEIGWAGHRMLKGTVAREVLGWKPAKATEEDLARDFLNELQAARDGRRGVTIGNCMNEEENKTK